MRKLLALGTALAVLVGVNVTAKAGSMDDLLNTATNTMEKVVVPTDTVNTKSSSLPTVSVTKEDNDLVEIKVNFTRTYGTQDVDLGPYEYCVLGTAYYDDMGDEMKRGFGVIKKYHDSNGDLHWVWRAEDDIKGYMTLYCKKGVTKTADTTEFTPNLNTAPDPETVALTSQVSTLQSDLSALESQVKVNTTNIGINTQDIDKLEQELSDLANNSEFGSVTSGSVVASVGGEYPAAICPIANGFYLELPSLIYQNRCGDRLYDPNGNMIAYICNYGNSVCLTNIGKSNYIIIAGFIIKK